MTIFQDKIKTCSDMRPFTENGKAGKNKRPRQEDTVGVRVAKRVSSLSVPQINCNVLVIMKHSEIVGKYALYKKLSLVTTSQSELFQ